MRAAWDAKNRLLALGVPLEFALYVLPNAKTLRFVSRGRCSRCCTSGLMRTCFNAQEEIYLASMDELDSCPRGCIRGSARSHRPALRRPQRPHRAALHRGHALLRHSRLARLPGRGAAALMSAPWRFEHELEVRFRDCDPMGHVNNAVYLTYLESARFAWWRSAFGPLGLKEHGFIVARVEIDYRKPALPGDRLLIRLRVDSIGRSSFAVGYEIAQREDARAGGRGEERAGRLRLLPGPNRPSVRDPPGPPRVIPLALRVL